MANDEKRTLKIDSYFALDARIELFYRLLLIFQLTWERNKMFLISLEFVYVAFFSSSFVRTSYFNRSEESDEKSKNVCIVCDFRKSREKRYTMGNARAKDRDTRTQRLYTLSMGKLISQVIK